MRFFCKECGYVGIGGDQVLYLNIMKKKLVVCAAKWCVGERYVWCFG